jgi:hypothetical protein
MAKKKSSPKTKFKAAGTKARTVTAYDSTGQSYKLVVTPKPLKKLRAAARPSSFVNFGGKEKQAPLPTSCHYSRNAAKESASKLRDRNVKARVVTSGKYFCVYTVGKCKKGSSI